MLNGGGNFVTRWQSITTGSASGRIGASAGVVKLSVSIEPGEGADAVRRARGRYFGAWMTRSIPPSVKYTGTSEARRRILFVVHVPLARVQFVSGISNTTTALPSCMRSAAHFSHPSLK